MRKLATWLRAEWQRPDVMTLDLLMASLGLIAAVALIGHVLVGGPNV